MQLLFLLLLIRLIPGAIIFYIFFRDARQYLVDFYQVFSSLVQDYDIQDLNKALPYFGEFLFQHVLLCLLGRPDKGILLFEFAAVKMLYFGLHSHPYTKVKHVCFG